MRPRARGGSIGALLGGALLFALLLPVPGRAAGATCPADHIDRHAHVAYVYDGDTVRLDDGTRVRFIGVNTTEIGHKGHRDEPYARAARQALMDLLRTAHGRIDLRYGRQRHDHYGRVLAHIYLPDGRSVERILIQRGLGIRITIPLNTRDYRCLSRAEAPARAAGRGVWSLARYRGTPVTALPDNPGGFRVVTGRVRAVNESRKAWWLEMHGFALRLSKRDLPYFHDLHPRDLAGRRLRARGWIYEVHGEARMNLDHPANVEWLAHD